MTERAYYYSDELSMQTQVLSCTPADDGRFRVVLAATLFHPQGGGQMSDTGRIDTAIMLQAVQEEGDVIHFTEKAVEPGPVSIQIDGKRRSLHSRYHSAGHIIACIGEQYGWFGYKGNHKPGEGRIVFKPADVTHPVTADDFSVGANEIVSRHLARSLREEEGRRKVTWGTLPDYACGGTHVVNTGDVGEILITKVKAKKGELTVQYALHDHPTHGTEIVQ
ncbi:alanyl-tRNA editing protein [Enterobacter sp. RHBSTW-00994]|uniref:alanyl-tRNA editing protein n=1 Tax=Enterobacter sp. RHBSTW-00994 TaxID=2742676 RepID=UPI0015EAD85A|nr:alanyl-tRNA editing protein [Enterobacter sp. RHBSTW-00994]QLR43396.1 alanyl-tRNA editing protein [Enterobacter sp. RHBSTW-00994]